MEIHAELVKPSSKAEMPKEVIAEIARETMKVRGEADMVLYTDGSAKEGIRDGGSAMYGEVNGVVVERMAPCSEWCSSFDTEVKAMDMAAEEVGNRRPDSCVIYTDSKAMVMALIADRYTSNKSLEALKEKLFLVSLHTRMRIQWIPSHVGLAGNETADALASEACKLDRSGTKLNFGAAKNVIGRVIKWRVNLEGRLNRIYKQRIKRHTSCTRRESVLMAQMRSGHCNSTSYYQHRIGTKDTPTCLKCGIDQEKDHILTCTAVSDIRRDLGIMDVKDFADEGKFLGLARGFLPA